MIITVTGGREPTLQARNLAQALGAEVLRRGHDLLNGGAEGVDTAAVKGAKMYRRQVPAGRVIVYRPESSVQPYAQGYTEVAIKGADHAERRDAIARDTDVLIILAGAKYTRDICQRAYNYGKLVLPVGFTGGTALELWHELKSDASGRYPYRSALTEADFLLLNPHDLKPEQAMAEQLIGLAERVTGFRKTPAAPAKLSATEKSSARSPFWKQYLQDQYKEHEAQYHSLTNRIAALNLDIGRELDSERRLVLEERRGELASERAQVVSVLEDIARQVAANAPSTGAADASSRSSEGGEAKRPAGDPCPPVDKPDDDVLYPFRHDSTGGLWGRMRVTRDTLQRNRSLLTRLQAQLQQVQLSNPLAVPAIEFQIAQMQNNIDKTQSDLDIQAEVLAWLLHRECLKQQTLQTELDALLAKPQRNLTETRRVGEIKQELAELHETAQEARPYLRELGVIR